LSDDPRSGAAEGEAPQRETPATEARAAWGHPSKDGKPWYPAAAVLVAIGLWLGLPDQFALPGVYRYIVTSLSIVLLVTLTYTRRSPRHVASNVPRLLSIVLIGVINATNLVSLVDLISSLLNSHVIGGDVLFRSAALIWLTNVIVFALWYWELDRGGPYQRIHRQHRHPDFLFPQMETHLAAPKGWSPQFIDYLYVSFTNATAFSPTDTMPLTPWAKVLMMVQSIASLITIALVAARAVNVLK
jgi:uncharacterized membrane protein